MQSGGIVGSLKGDPRVDATTQGKEPQCELRKPTLHTSIGLPPSEVDPITYRGPASLHHHHGTVWMIIAGGPQSRTIMKAEKAWQDVCGKPSKPSTRRTAVWLSTGMIPNPRGKPTLPLLPSSQPAVVK